MALHRCGQYRPRALQQVLEGPFAQNASDGPVQLRRAVAELPDFQRKVVLLKMYGEMTLQQVSELLGCPLSTVNSRLQYAIEKIRRAMREGLDGAPAGQV